MKIVLAALEDKLVEAWKKHCGDLISFVHIMKGSILDTGCNALVSPANAFGFMDGGIDSLYSQKFGWGLQKQAQNKIKSAYNGELLIGQAFSIETGADLPKYLVVAPTMRVPTVLSKKTINPYLATRAALRVFLDDKLGNIAFPGMGTGVGQVDHNICAMQMREAIDEVILGHEMFPNGWMDAKMRHEYLATGKVIPFEKQSQKAFEE